MTDHSAANAAAVEKWTTYVQNDWARAEKVTRQTAFLILPHLRLDDLMDPIKYPEPHFLEVGCGSGAAAQLAFTELPPGVKQVCTDLTPAMLDAASEVLPEDTTFVKTDAMDLTFKDNQFERYWSNYVIHLVPDPVAMAKEAFRVVKPGGIAAFSFFGRPEHSPQFMYMHQCITAAGITLPPRPHDVFALGKNLTSTTRQMFLDAGFTKVQVTYSTVMMPIGSGEEYWKVVSPPGSSGASLLKNVPAEKLDDVKQRFIDGVNAQIAAGEFPARHEAAIVICEK